MLGILCGVKEIKTKWNMGHIWLKRVGREGGIYSTGIWALEEVYSSWRLMDHWGFIDARGEYAT